MIPIGSTWNILERDFPMCAGIAVGLIHCSVGGAKIGPRGPTVEDLLVSLLGGPEGEVVPQQLHDEGGILVGVFGDVVQLGNGVLEGLARHLEENILAHLLSHDDPSSWYTPTFLYCSRHRQQHHPVALPSVTNIPTGTSRL